jgi:tetratricopeptide (TPR) repeat protein
MTQVEPKTVTPPQFEETVLKCNQQAMELMNRNNFLESAKLLLKANQILSNLTPTYSVIKLKAVTLNNLGCVYKRGEDNSKALHYLSQALEYEKKLPEEYTNIAGTHLNLCAIKSHLDDHNSALDHALAAVNIIQRNYTGKHEFVTTLVAAYHNAGIEYQFLNRKIEANNFFRQGFDLAVKNLGRNHSLTKNLEAMMPKKFESEVFMKEINKQAIFKPESRIFEGSPEKKIKVDTTPWPKFTEKKSWPGKIDPIGQSEITPKPKLKYPKHVKSEYSLDTPPYPKFPERPLFNPSELDSEVSSISPAQKSRQLEVPGPARVPSKGYLQQKPSNHSLSDRKRNNIHLHHDTNEKSQEIRKKPSNLRMSQPERQNFKISTKSQPKPTKSLNSSPSKSTVSAQSLISVRNPSNHALNSQITAEKINQLSTKLETLQEKLNHFEENYKKMNTLEEVNDDESVISTMSVVNSRRTNAAILIQKHIRRFLIQKRFKEMREAAVKIQKVRRGHCARERVRIEFFKNQDFSQQAEFEAIDEPPVIKTEEKSNQTDFSRRKPQGQIVLVSKQGVRAWKKRRALLDHIVLIQAHMKGHLARKLKIKRLNAVKVIQRAFKSYRIRSIFRKIVSAIIFIQSVFRGHKARKYARSLLPKGVIARVLSRKRW